MEKLKSICPQKVAKTNYHFRRTNYIETSYEISVFILFPYINTYNLDFVFFFNNLYLFNRFFFIRNLRSHVL